MSGYVAMARDWQDHGLFDGDEFSRRDAWAWLIANAAWKGSTVRIKGSSVILARGELTYSVRFLAEKWGWSKSRVDRFIAALRAEGMIETRSKIGTTAGHSAGQGQSIITICNYDQFQLSAAQDRDSEQTEIGTTAGQQRDKEEPSNQETNNQKKINAPAGAKTYAFEGRVIRLKRMDFDQWQANFPDIDLLANLQARDDWLANEADASTRKRWFMSTSNHLRNLQQRALTARREAANYDRDRITV